MKFQSIILIIFVWPILAGCSPYAPRGWRPQGQSFNPSSNHLNIYGPPSAPLIYGSHSLPTRQPALVTTPPSTTTAAAAATASATAAATTPKSREPTTASPVPEEDDYETNPALAVANSFAFNRPVYILNALPIQTAAYPFFK